MVSPIDKLRIAVIDDDEAVRSGVMLVLERQDRCVRGFASGNEFLNTLSADKDCCNLALIDLKMPGLSGLDVLRALGTPPFPILMMSAQGDVKSVVQALKLGATDFIEKPFTAEELDHAIANALGELEQPDRQQTILDALTPREREVALLLNEGLTNKEIAQRLDCSPRTVEIHRAHVFKKLDVRNVTGLVHLLASGN